MLKRIDTNTVLKLQLKAPRNCEKDSKYIKGLTLSGEIFSSFNESERKGIWKRIKKFDGIIPSLQTFWKDFIFFEQCVHCIKRLFGAANGSIWNTMKGIFVDTGDEEALIQTSESSFRRQAASDADRLDLGYRQLWLYAMRHYKSMPPPARSEDELLVKRDRGELDERVLFEMAGLAQRLGFWSTEINHLLQISPDRLIARNALLRARNPDNFHYDPVQLEVLVDRVSACFSAAKEYRKPEPELLADSEVPIRRRCGFPQKKAHTQDAPHLFLDQVHAENSFAPVTTYFVQRCFYYAFFGRRSLPKQRAGESDQGIPPRDTSPLFVDEDETSSLAPGVTKGASERVSAQKRPIYENPQTRRLLEGHNSLRTEGSAERAHYIETEGFNESSDVDIVDASFDASEGYSQNVSPAGSKNGRALALEKSASDHENPGNESPNPPMEYSPSVYSIRRSGVENRDNEPQRLFSDNLTRMIEERERVDNDWEQERLAQERGEPAPNTQYITECVSSEETFKDNVEHPSRGQRNEALSNPRDARDRIETEEPASQHERRVKRPQTSREQRINGKSRKLRNEYGEKANMIVFSFLVVERGQWRAPDTLMVDPSEPLRVEHIAREYIRKGFSLYDKHGNSLSPTVCFRAGVTDGNNAVIVIPEKEKANAVDKAAAIPRLGVPGMTERPSKQTLLQVEERSESRSESL